MHKLAIGLIAAAGLALAIPANANAEELSVGAGPAGVGIGVHHDNWRHHYARDEDDVVVRRGHERHCKLTIVHRDGEVRKIRRCW